MPEISKAKYSEFIGWADCPHLSPEVCEAMAKEILEEAGQRVGLLDNRPQKYGENGCFKVTKWKEV